MDPPGEVLVAPPAAPLALQVLALSDSFGTVWPALAAELGLELMLATDCAGSDPAREGIAVVAAGGVEEEAEAAIRQLGPGAAERVVVGAVADHRLAIALTRAGAAEYFALPQDGELLRSWVQERAVRLRGRLTGQAFAEREAAKYRFEGMIGHSRALRDTLQRAARVIPHRTVNVLITGETGTGKELLAKAIHYNGPRRSAPFVDINCAAIPDQLLESELFGHEQGAFTGATVTKPGLFEAANGGTLFLDEIGHLPLPLQGKLLRVIDQRTVRRLGDTRLRPVDVRLLAATHVDLARSVTEGTFREDLYHRLNVVTIRMPALRTRREDIASLARHFLARFAADYDRPEPSLTTAALQTLRLHAWPGNVRELRNVIERAVLLAPRRTLDTADLDLGNAPPAADANVLAVPASLDQIAHSAAGAMTPLCDGNKSEAARRLGISRARLLRLLKSRNDPPDDFGDHDDGPQA
ncbi:MAG: sigma-54 dependent transcriptional regulator [Gemmatimonadota bacterium]|nr:sigma-54 dependent transcriptional regulator [Gemmatimonadota bacterium]